MSSDIAGKLLYKSNEIVGLWAKASNGQVSSSSDASMTYEALYSRLPQIIDLIAIRLSSSNVLTSATSDLSPITVSPITVQVKLGFDLAELLRGFRTLRTLILSTIEIGKSNGAEEVSQIVRKIDEVLDSITVTSVAQYVEYQLEQSEPMHRQLLSNNQELIRTVQKQKDNASHLAHELKNPLNAIISFSSILLRKWSKADAPGEESQFVERILENGRRILALIENMLETSRQSAQKPSLHIESIEVAKLIERVTESLRADATQKGLALNMDCALAPPIIDIDSLRLQQIMVNLISNAIRYTDEGEISVRCYGISDEQWAFSVTDTGRGICEEEQAAIFKPYIRAGSEESHLSNSSGLGLAIVQKLVTLLQGEIMLESELGQGSTFTVNLPLEIVE